MTAQLFAVMIPPTVTFFSQCYLRRCWPIVPCLVISFGTFFAKFPRKAEQYY